MGSLAELKKIIHAFVSLHYDYCNVLFTGSILKSKILVLIYRALNGQAPDYLSQLFTRHTAAHSLWSQVKNTYTDLIHSVS